MKTITFIIVGLFYCQFLWAHNDSLSYYVLNNSDTNYVNSLSDITDCNYLISTAKSHNKCPIIINGSRYSGKISYHIYRADSTLEVFDGDKMEGYIQIGTVLRYSISGQLCLSGQYSDNWKYGIWTTYYKSGKVESIMKFIKLTDEPVIEWEYDEFGLLEYYNNEQKEIEKIIENTH